MNRANFLQRAIYAVGISLTLSLSLSTNVFATDLPADKEAQAEELFGSLLSPFCPGRLISDCPSGKASELKEQVRSELAAGRSIDAVRQQLVSQFGEDTLRPVPKEEGFGLIGWFLPAIFFLIGAAILTKWLRGMSVQTTSPESAQNFDPALEERIRKDLEGL